MSSLSATQADGYYVPPEYFDSGTYKKQSKNQFAGSKGHNQFLQKGIVRFELPYKGVCRNCQTSVGRGTRYNAQKAKTADSYFTTPIWEFQMTCRNCQHPWKIRTNPQQRSFDYVEGVTIQAGQEEVMMDATSSSVGRDEPSSSLDRLESVARGQRHTETELERLQALQNLQSQTTLEDARLNASIRSNFRTDRKLQRWKRHQASNVGWREGMEWLNTTVDDQVAAKEAVFGQPHKEEAQRLSKVRKSSIFDSSASSSSKKRHRRVSKGPTTLQHLLPSPIAISSRADINGLGISVEETLETTHGDQPLNKTSKPAAAPRRVKQKIQLYSTTAAMGVKEASSKKHNHKPSLKIVTKEKESPSSAGLQAMLAAYGSSDSEASDDPDDP